MTGPLIHCPTCTAPHLATRPCPTCTRLARAAGRRAEMERERIAHVEQVKRARKRRAKESRVSASEAERIAAMAGAFDGERGLEPMGVHRFRGHGGQRAFEAYERAYREARR